MRYVRGFLFFWYDFLVGDAWDVALGVVVVLAVMAALVRARPGLDAVLGPVLVASVVLLTWISLRREVRGHR